MYIVLLVILAIIIFGPSKLPEAGKSLGKMMREFRQAVNTASQSIQEEVEATQAENTKANK